VKTALVLGGGGMLGAYEVGMLCAGPGCSGQERAEPAVAAARRALAAIAPCPEADVSLVAQAGLDRLVSVADIGRSLPMD
jgi:hypothetical protein